MTLFTSDTESFSCRFHQSGSALVCELPGITGASDEQSLAQQWHLYQEKITSAAIALKVDSLRIQVGEAVFPDFNPSEFLLAKHRLQRVRSRA